MIQDRSRYIVGLIATLGLLAGEFLSSSEPSLAVETKTFIDAQSNELRQEVNSTIRVKPARRVSQCVMTDTNELRLEINSRSRSRSAQSEDVQDSNVTNQCNRDSVIVTGDANTNELRQENVSRIRGRSRDRETHVNKLPQAAEHSSGIDTNASKKLFHETTSQLPICRNPLIKIVFPWKCR